MCCVFEWFTYFRYVGCILLITVNENTYLYLFSISTIFKTLPLHLTFIENISMCYNILYIFYICIFNNKDSTLKIIMLVVYCMFIYFAPMIYYVREYWGYLAIIQLMIYINRIIGFTFVFFCFKLVLVLLFFL